MSGLLNKIEQLGMRRRFADALVASDILNDTFLQSDLIGCIRISSNGEAFSD